MSERTDELLERILRKLEQIHETQQSTQEAILANTDALTAAIANLQTAATAAIAQLGSASSDQPAIDAATSQISTIAQNLAAATTPPAAPAAPTS